MAAYRSLLRQTPLVWRSIQHRPVTLMPQFARYASSSTGGQGKRRGLGRFVSGLLVALAAGGVVFIYYPTTIQEPPRNREAVIEYEKPRPLPETKEDSRDLISSQHLQVKKSWEHPGVYCWGSNSGRVAAPDSTDTVIKTPRRIAYFDGQLIRDIKLDKEFGAAITERGDLVQWGTGFSKENPLPTPTLKGKNLVHLEISRDRIIALGKDGSVYSLPVAQSDQSSGQKSTSSSWSFWSNPSKINYRRLNPKGLGWGESVVNISSGLEHVLLLTSRGRVFSAASSTSDFPSKGQLGIPGLTWNTRPQGSYDQPHEIDILKGFKISQVAAGDYHSLALEQDGRVFVFGDNSSGQLGFEVEKEIPFVDGPIPLPFSKMYRGTHEKPQVTSIAAGGANSFFTVDATRIALPNEDSPRDLGRITSDVWACGSGIWGSLGNGKWTHVSLGPSKIKSLSGLSEFDESKNKVVPIRFAYLSVGSTHASAVMKNVTRVDASDKTSDQDTNWGADVLWWGGNEHYQLGTGRRNNVATPIYIGPLDGGEGDAEKGRKDETHRLQISPRTTVRLGEGGKGRKATIEQRVECGRFVTAVYSAP
ncbi:regulator of chromosome condensation 1/beta-lactamase-inhibitor protein II [Xylaria digitata]|nr:regulator of chromosome condensation 1/beta-lactamase-inhibitor protein II [Xylaria digitata]